MAPGVLILATFQPHFPAARIGRNIDLSADYNLLSGTSMACPNISGVLALLKAAHPDGSNTVCDDDHRQSSGHHESANQGTGRLSRLPSGQDLVNLVCSMNFTRNHTLTIIRSSYNCSNPLSDRRSCL
ncbi:hypothetical protein SASPL_132293 [Salvia splendens]|uniref:Peptidase S8/S53 domain-containing protein n=1 Tax=Salvia splendens TaxID=180675 RepID=A0A8X8ZLS9_SALSN|nr:hypothetical protein SASPL_132293 [Salvia splendens]